LVSFPSRSKASVVISASIYSCSSDFHEYKPNWVFSDNIIRILVGFADLGLGSDLIVENMEKLPYIYVLYSFWTTVFYTLKLNIGHELEQNSKIQVLIEHNMPL
jgi:hypothetical protein